MATITINLSTEHVQRLATAIEYDKGLPQGAAVLSDGKDLIVQYLKDYTLWNERQKYLDDAAIDNIDPT